MLTASLAVMTGCQKNGTDVENGDFSIDGSEHTITFTIDTPVETFWITDSQTSETIEGTVNDETQTITCEGAWYSAEAKLGSSKEIILKVDENTSQEDREIRIHAYYMGHSGSMVIIQKAQRQQQAAPEQSL